MIVLDSSWSRNTSISVLFQMVIFFLFPFNIDALRVFVGPLPQELCSLGVFFKNFILTNISLITLIMTCTKFAFVYIYKSIPVMEDTFLSIFCYIGCSIISAFAAFSRMFLNGPRPIRNEVRVYRSLQ